MFPNNVKKRGLWFIALEMQLTENISPQTIATIVEEYMLKDTFEEKQFIAILS